MDKNVFPKGLKPWQIGVLFSGLIILSFLFIMPGISQHIDSFASFGILFLILSLSLTFFDAVLELATSFLGLGGGFFLYLSKAYNRWLAFVLSFTFQLLLYLLSLFFLYRVFFDLTNNVFFTFIIVVFLIFLFNALFVLLRQKVFSVISWSFLIPALLLVVSLVIAFLGLYIRIPQFTFSLFSWSAISSHVFLLFSLILFPLSLFFSELPRAEESLPYIFKKIIPFFFIGFLVSVLLMANFDFSNFYTSFFEVVSSNIFFQIAFLVSLLLFVFIIWFSASRLLFSLSKNELLPSFLGVFSSKGVPKNIFIFQSFLLLFLSSILFFNSLLEHFFVLILFFASLEILFLTLGIHLLRKRLPDLERPFAISHYKQSVFLLVILSSVVFILFLLRFLSLLDWLLLIILLLVSSLVYVLFEDYYSEWFYAWLSSLFPKGHFFQRLRVTPFARKKLLSYVDLLDGRSVHEYGAQSGFFSALLLERMKGKGLLYVSDRSHKAVHRLKSLFSSKNSALLKIIFLTDFPSAIHPSIQKIDFFFSAGIFWHVRHVDRLLKELNALMHHNSRLLIHTPSKFFFKPLKWWSDDKTIKDYFSRDGFHILIETHRAWYGEYKIIRGVRSENARLLSSWFELKD